MRRLHHLGMAWAAAMLWSVTLAGVTAFAQEAPPRPSEGDDEAEVLTRGPIHEAFAEPLTEPEPTLVIKKAPPEDIEEVPPEYAPDEEGAEWIAGYWAWDDDRDDFIWISGVYRVAPPDMRWVAGYWAEVEDGWQWNPGFWTAIETEELVYYKTPPESLEEGPSSPSPGDDHFWVPGNWVYQDEYRWSPGYWAVHRPNWMWVPTRWVWTPRGCIYLPGRWDYIFERRGFCYAPIYYHSPIYSRPGYIYRPWCGLNVGNLFVHFWIRPNYCHYYFGNYYGNYDRWGLSPWSSWSGRGGFYDPILTWNHVHFRSRGVDFVDRMSSWHNYYERHTEARPPQTWAEQTRLISQSNITNITEINQVTNVAVRQNFLTGRVQDLARMDKAPVRLKRMDESRQREVEQRAKEIGREIKEVRQQRRESERSVARTQPADVPDRSGEKGTGRAAAEVRLKLAKSRVATRQPKVEVPERPDRDRPGAGERAGERERPERTSRTPGEKGERPERPGEKGERPGEKGERPDSKGKRPDTKGERPDTKGERPDTKGKRPDTKGDRPERPGAKGDRPDVKGERPERPERPDTKGERPERPGEKGERPGEKGERPDTKGKRPDTKGERPEHPDSTEPPGRAERPDRATAPDRPDRTSPARPERPDRAEPRGKSDRPSPERSKGEIPRTADRPGSRGIPDSRPRSEALRPEIPDEGKGPRPRQDRSSIEPRGREPGARPASDRPRPDSGASPRAEPRSERSKSEAEPDRSRPTPGGGKSKSKSEREKEKEKEKEKEREEK